MIYEPDEVPSEALDGEAYRGYVASISETLDEIEEARRALDDVEEVLQALVDDEYTIWEAREAIDEIEEKHNHGGILRPL